MTQDVMIRAEGLGKKYVIGHQRPAGGYSFREMVASGASRLGRGLVDLARGKPILDGQSYEEFWALKGASFEIKRGDVVGIIGNNGAGKSTLLKMLSRITEPSEGRAEIRGRVASLLEIGTGFHPELSGRENIFLNGAILGMRHAEIKAKFDEIVAFSGLERFLDTPVKRYSSGMYVRLAFAVAAHVEPEIMILDEVLAVGDAEFQRKCLGRIHDVSAEGRTVLFVSHNMDSVAAICKRAILFRDGQVLADGPADTVIQQYGSKSPLTNSMSFEADTTRPSISRITVDSGALLNRDLVVEIGFVSPTPLQKAIGDVVIHTPTSEPIWSSSSKVQENYILPAGCSHGVLRCEARDLPVSPGDYVLSVSLSDPHGVLDRKSDALRIKIGKERVPELRSTPVIGHLDWPATWSARSEEVS